MSCSYQMEEETFTEVSCVNNLHTGEVGFCSCTFWRFVRLFSLERIRNCNILWSVRVFFTFLEKKIASKYSLQEVYISLEKQQFRLLVTFSLIFVADTKIIFGYSFAAPLRFGTNLKWKWWKIIMICNWNVTFYC